jgi:PHD/YefM family antitoxin component YafN of YafNO toxin-antitoxin module
MSAGEAIRELRRGFALRDQVSLSELRGTGWRERLARARKLRLVDRNEPVGVLVSPELWEALEQVSAYLEQIEEELEEYEIGALWAHRLEHPRRPAVEEARRLQAMLERG